MSAWTKYGRSESMLNDLVESQLAAMHNTAHLAHTLHTQYFIVGAINRAGLEAVTRAAEIILKTPEDDRTPKQTAGIKALASTHPDLNILGLIYKIHPSTTHPQWAFYVRGTDTNLNLT